MQEVFMKKLIFSIFLAFNFNFASAAIVNTGYVDIKSIYAYDDYIGGQVLIKTSNTTVSACVNGVYLNASAPGMDRMYRMILSASLSRIQLRFQVYNDRLFGSSSGGYCEVDAVLLVFQ
jgi:hypothetical protein